MKVKFLIYSAFLSFCASGFLFGQSSNFVTFGVEEGLIQSHVQTLQQDNEGNLWIGTIGGLTKYNGTKFTNYTQESGLSEDWITVSLKDRDGNLWFGHWGGGLTVFDFRNKKFVDLKSEVFTNYKKVSSITEDRSGTIFIGTEGSGIAVFRTFHELGLASGNDSVKKTVTPEMIKDIWGKPESIPNITALFADNNNRLWIGTSSGITVYDIPSRKTLGTFNTANGFPDNSVQCIIQPYGNELWIGTENAGIVRLRIDKVTFPEMVFSDPAIINKITTLEKLTSDNIKTLFADKDHIIWIGTKGEGINRFLPNGIDGDFAGGEVHEFSNKFEQKYYNANIFFQDREENTWIGTEIGLHRYTGELFKVYNYNDGLVSNLVWAILHDRQGSFWFSTSDGVSRFTFPESKGEKQYNNASVKNYTVAENLPDNLIISMFEDSKGRVWFGTQSKGVSVLSKELKKVRGKEDTEVEVFKNYSVSNGLIDNNIFSINEDGDGNLWFGTRNGVSRLNPETNEVKNFTVEDGLGGNKAFKIFRDSKNNLWFGILGGYLTCYDGKEFKTYNLNQKFILSMDEDKLGNLWFGAYGGGIIKYNPGETSPEKQFHNFTVDDGLSSNSPLFIVCDSQGNVWIGQSRGIEKFDAQSQRFSLYSRQQGFPGVETNENAVTIDKEGNIWFGAIKGVIKFAPAKEKVSKTEPLTNITSLKLFMKEIPFKDDFSYKENYLSFFCLAICLTNPKDVQYQYKLEGFDAEWNSATSVNSVTYSNLPPGEYTFLVKASNGEKVWNQIPVQYAFTITPPFWETLWFRISAIVLVIAILFLFIKWRESALKKEKKILEEKVTERTRELREEKEVVEKQNSEIQKKNLNITESIGYAKRIQQAILPSFETVAKLLPDSFIFYKPKDIVSGDFFWVHQSGTKILFATVDCTGHGVPGAFMSIIGHNILEQITREQRLLEPAAILNLLSKEVSNSLSKSTTATLKDGMDIALCSLDISNNTLQFAAAGNSLYLVNPKRTSWPSGSTPFSGNLPGAEIKADRQSIGAQTINRPFTNHRLSLEKGDMLFVFSDGFADQKGGVDKKKFYYAPFRKLLCEIYDMPFVDQRKHLKQTIIDWMGDTEQYDDMLIFGVKI